MAFAILYPQEAWVSGSAGIRFFEDGMRYVYTEHGRKRPRAEDYEEYFAKKQRAMLAVIQHSAPEFRAWKKSVAEAGLAIEDAPIFRTASSDSRMSTIRLQGERGDTVLEVEWREAPTAADRKKLEALSGTLEFSKLEEKWNLAGAPSLKKEGYQSGLMVVRAFPKFTLSLAMTSDFRKELEPEILRALEQKMADLAPRIEKGFEELASRHETWINPSTLRSYESVFGKLPAGEELRQPAKSKFNFYGPLFDSFGGRTAAAIGAVKVSMLFLSSDPSWENNKHYASNRGGFEEWFRWAVREPKEVESEMNGMLEKYLASASTGDNGSDQASKDELERLLKRTALYSVATKPIIQKLREIALDGSAKSSLVRHVLDLLVWIPSEERTDVVREFLEKNKFSGGHAGTTPIVMQAAQRIISETFDSQNVKRERDQKVAAELLELLIKVHQKPDLSAEDATWTKVALGTLKNSVRSSMASELEGKKIDKAYLQKMAKRLDELGL